jgi:hypothetical protein
MIMKFYLKYWYLIFFFYFFTQILKKIFFIKVFFISKKSLWFKIDLLKISDWNLQYLDKKIEIFI